MTENIKILKIIGEIREPNKFKDYIYAYAGRNNVRFQYLMDKLNDSIQKKKLSLRARIVHILEWNSMGFQYVLS